MGEAGVHAQLSLKQKTIYANISKNIGPANSTCKLNSSGVEPIQGSMAMTAETGAITIKAKAMMTETPEILLAQLVSEFIRHAGRHDGACDRKRAFVKKTCDELREQSDIQLALAMRQCRSGVIMGKKRKWDVATLGSDFSGPRADFDGGMTALDKSLRQINESDSLRQLGSAHIDLSAPSIPMQSPITLPRLATMADPINPNMSSEEMYFNTGEGQTQGFDLLQDFDAPILQIMNSVPALTTGWAAQDDIIDMTTEVTAMSANPLCFHPDPQT
ncbi:hypothetical protein N7481_001429 [Penicillium waksmanii]|uniref:uncharacterized protein n=1 Tax=Penicillium waksmanii TaxID=69791 RepID=UPI0025485637|nr:uncharacterized protein N7481_001429 [Penicillium waksmanii]KAJ6001020.1 hypothetical protein N7481_001429 [Penicillium waksmanii]